MGQHLPSFFFLKSFLRTRLSCSPTRSVNADAVCRDRHPTRRARLSFATTLSSKGVSVSGTAIYGLC